MSTENNQLNKIPIGAIVSVIGSMSGFFVALSTIFSGVEAPIAALLIGLVITGALYFREFWSIQTAILTWVITGLVLIIIYFIISQPATVNGWVSQDDGTPLSGLSLILTNARGIQQHVVTDIEGQFVVVDVPQGRYTITISTSNRLLYTGDVPSGWQRIFLPTINTGGLISIEDMTATPNSTPTDTLVPPTSIATDTDILTPTDTSEPPTATDTPTAMDTDIPTPTDTPTATDTDTPTPTITLTPTPRPTRTPRPTNTATATPTDIPEELILYEEDFEDGIAAQWINERNRFVVKDDGTGNRVLSGVGDGTEAHLSVPGSMQWSNYAVQFRFYVVDWNAPSSFELSIRSPNAGGNYLLVISNNEYHWVRHDKNYQQFPLPRGSAGYNFLEGEWHSVYVEMQDSNIRWQFDNGRLYELSDDSYQTGTIEFSIWDMVNGEIYFDDIIVWSLDTND